MAQQVEFRIDMEDRSRWEILSANNMAKQHLLYLQEVGKFYSGPAYYTTRRKLDSYLIKLTFSGKGTLTYGDSSYDITPGDFFWIDCREYQDYRTAEDSDHWHVLWVHFYGPHAASCYALFQQLNHGHPVGHLADPREARQLLEQLVERNHGSSGELSADIRNAGLMHQLLSVLLEAVSVPPVPKLPDSVSAIQSYLMENYSRSITLEELSRQFNLSKFHLLRVFRQHLGLTPLAYLRNIRITKAKELLRVTSLSVGMIASSVGMDSLSYFIAAFKKQEGVTPLKYRSLWSNDLSL